MVRRILRSMYAIGIDKWGPPAPTVDMANHNETGLKTALQSIVLLKNEGALLPLLSDKRLKIAVIMDNH